MQLVLLVFQFAVAFTAIKAEIINSVAGWTYYYAWPSGVFAGIGPRTLDYIETNNLVAFYNSADPLGNNYYSTWANKNIQLTAECNGKTYQFTALIADTCLGQVCTTNSNAQTGYLVDMEYYTVMNNFGTTDCVTGNINFSVDLGQPPVLQNCGSVIGYCGGHQCCSADNYCGSTSEYCGTGCQIQYGPCSSPTSTPPTSAECGPGVGSCTGGLCCSQCGYCGSTSSFCGSGCQEGYGSCISTTSTPSPTATPTVNPTTQPLPAPVPIPVPLPAPVPVPPPVPAPVTVPTPTPTTAPIVSTLPPSPDHPTAPSTGSPTQSPIMQSTPSPTTRGNLPAPTRTTSPSPNGPVGALPSPQPTPAPSSLRKSFGFKLFESSDFIKMVLLSVFMLCLTFVYLQVPIN